MENNRKNTIVIGAVYGLGAVNFLIAFVLSLVHASADWSYIALALVFTVMVPVSITDPRKEMRGGLAAFLAIFVIAGVGIMLALFTASRLLLGIALTEFLALLTAYWRLGK